MNSAAHLRLIPGPDREPRSVTQLFHRVGRLIPEAQEVLTIPPDTKAGDALALMAEHAYTQLPVVVGRAVLGMFSYRSFSLGVTRMGEKAGKVADLPVEEFLEKPAYARVTDEFTAIIEHLNAQDAVLIGHEELLQHVVTPIDVLRYLHGVANAFVLLEEIELSLRALIRMAVDDATFMGCAQRSLGRLYKPDTLPSKLEDMTLHDVVQVVRDGRNWEGFKCVFGGSRERVGARLGPLPDLRNDVFHFKREITFEDHEVLADLRDWLLIKVRAAEASRKGEANV